MAKLYHTQLKRSRTCALRVRHLLLKAQTKNTMNWNCSLKRIARTIVLTYDAGGKGLSSAFDLAKVGHSRCSRPGWWQYAQTRAVAAQSLTKRQLLIFSIDNSILKSLSIKEKKYFLVGSTHMQIKNGILIKSGTPTGTTTNQVAKLTDVAKLSPVSALLLSTGYQ